MGLDPFTLGIGGSLLSSAIGSDAAGDAADTQAAAADRAAKLQDEQIKATVQRNQPFLQGGTSAFNALLDRLGVSGNTGADGYGSFSKVPSAQDVMAEPGYEFGRSEGLKALTNQLNASGMSYSGPAAKALTRYGNDYATGQYGNAYNRLQSGNQQIGSMLGNVANMGQNSANLTGQAGASYANNAGNALWAGAGANAAGQLAQGNIWQNALNQGISQYKNRPGGGDGGSTLGGATWSDVPQYDPWWQG